MIDSRTSAAIASGTRRRVRTVDQTQCVGRKHDRNGCDRAGLDDEEQGPTVEETGERMQALAEGRRTARLPSERVRPVRHNKGAGESDRSADDPGPEHQRGRVEPPSNDVGIDEDAGADDAPDHHHRGVERTEDALEGRRGIRRRPPLPASCGSATTAIRARCCWSASAGPWRRHRCRTSAMTLGPRLRRAHPRSRW